MAVWWHFLVAVPTAAFLVNGIPHFIQGISGKPFPSPFSGGPPNDDPLAWRNVLWGAANLIVGAFLLWVIRDGLGDWLLVVELIGVGVAMAVLLAQAMSGAISFRRR